jgi:alpha-tubulin suppressor-like RCC1 family protein
MRSRPARAAATVFAVLVTFGTGAATAVAAAEVVQGAAHYHTAVIQSDGSLWTWGRNDWGQLGLGTEGDWYDRPQRVGSDTWTAVAAGTFHTLAVRSDGTLWTWGDLENGLQGVFPHEEPHRRTTPFQVGTDSDWASVAAGWYYSLGVKRDGSLWGWGLHFPGGWDYAKPTCGFSVPCRLPDTGGWRVIAGGHGGAAGLNTGIVGIKEDGSLWEIGAGGETRIGADSDWKTVAAGTDCYLAVKTDGSIWKWSGNPDFYAPSPVLLTHDKGWKEVAMGSYNQAAAVKDDGSLWRWNHSGYNDPCYPPFSGTEAFERVGDRNDWAKVFVGEQTYFAVTSGGSLHGWGWNRAGELGIGQTGTFTTPVQAGGSAGWVKVEAGAGASFGLKADGSLWGWGSNWYGNLGLGDRQPRTIPQEILPGAGWLDVSAGSGFAFAVRSDGTLWSWGRNDSGHLGRGLGILGERLLTPGQVGAETDWRRAASGQLVTFLLKADGSLWALGMDALGHPSLIDSGPDTPVRLGSDNDWKDISVGYSYALARKADDSLWYWGAPVRTGDFVGPYLTPVLATAASVSAGFYIHLATAPDGALVKWGADIRLPLAGPEAPPVTYSPPEGSTAWLSPTGGGRNAAALANDGSLWTWGANTFGQLGNGEVFPLAIDPVKVGEETDWAAVDQFWTGMGSSDRIHTLALKGDGTLWGWGDNSCGGLGVGRVGSPTEPVRIIPAAPEIVRFSRDRSAPPSGRQVTLSWQAGHAGGCQLAPGIGPVPAEGQVTVSPESTTTYTLRCSDGAEMVSASWTEQVVPTVRDGSFEVDGSAWEGIGLAQGDGVTLQAARTGSRSFAVAGSAAAKSVSQLVRTGGLAGQGFSLSAWSRSRMARLVGGTYTLEATFLYRDGTRQVFRRPFRPGTHAWERLRFAVVAAKDFTAVKVTLRYGRQTGRSWFDDVRLQPL